MKKNVIISFFSLAFLLTMATNSFAYFGWEDGTTQGWVGETFNTTKYYYSGQHSLGIDLNFIGDGFKSSKTTLPFCNIKTDMEISQLAFKIFIPSLPAIPLDLKAQIYIEDIQGRTNRNRWTFLLTDSWNDVVIDIPVDFQEPVSVAIIFGTNFQYTGKVYVDQAEAPIPNDLSDGFYNNAFYDTYVPNFSETQELQLIPTIEVITDTMPKTGGFGAADSEEDNKKVVFEYETFLLLSFGLFIFSITFLKHNPMA